MSNEDLVAREHNPRDHSVIVAADVEHYETADNIGRWKSPLQFFRVAPACCIYHLVPRAQPLLGIGMLLPEDSELLLANHPHRAQHIRILRTKPSNCLGFTEE